MTEAAGKSGPWCFFCICFFSQLAISRLCLTAGASCAFFNQQYCLLSPSIIQDQQLLIVSLGASSVCASSANLPFPSCVLQRVHAVLSPIDSPDRLLSPSNTQHQQQLIVVLGAFSVCASSANLPFPSCVLQQVHAVLSPINSCVCCLHLSPGGSSSQQRNSRLTPHSSQTHPPHTSQRQGHTLLTPQVVGLEKQHHYKI